MICVPHGNDLDRGGGPATRPPATPGQNGFPFGPKACIAARPFQQPKQFDSTRLDPPPPPPPPPPIGRVPHQRSRRRPALARPRRRNRAGQPRPLGPAPRNLELEFVWCQPRSRNGLP